MSLSPRLGRVEVFRQSNPVATRNLGRGTLFFLRHAARSDAIQSSEETIFVEFGGFIILQAGSGISWRALSP